MTDDPVLTISGVPMRLGSISGGRFDLAPDVIRDALDRFVAHRPDEPARLADLGLGVRTVPDLESVAELDPGDAFDRIEAHIGALLVATPGDPAEPTDAVVVLGGDNSITRPGVHAAAAGAGLERTGVLTIDAHHDLRETADGLTNGNPMRALLEDGLPGGNVVQVGIQPLANPAPSADVARDAEIQVFTADVVRERGVETIVGGALRILEEQVDAIYVDLDVDVLDRAFAPACPGARPGGLTPAEVQRAAQLCGAHPKVRAMDVVEVDPARDVAEATAMAAASFVLSFAAGVARRSGP